MEAWCSNSHFLAAPGAFQPRVEGHHFGLDRGTLVGLGTQLLRLITPSREHRLSVSTFLREACITQRSLLILRPPFGLLGYRFNSRSKTLFASAFETGGHVYRASDGQHIGRLDGFRDEMLLAFMSPEDVLRAAEALGMCR